MRKLVTIEQFIEDMKAEGLETDQVYIDPDDAVEIPEAEDQDQDQDQMMIPRGCDSATEHSLEDTLNLEENQWIKGISMENI